MRRIAIMLLMALTTISAAAQNKTFIAVSKSGDCSLLDNGQWIPLQVGTRLSPQSVLRNSGQPEAEIQLVGLETGDRYKLFILHSQFKMRTLFDAPRKDYTKGTASSYFRYVLQSALEANADTHFIRNYTGATHRSDSLAMCMETERIVYTLSNGASFSFDALKKAPSDYPISATVIPGGVIFDNGADIDLGFVLYNVQKSEQGLVLTSVFGDENDEDEVIIVTVPAKTQIYKESDKPLGPDLLLIAYEKPINPITLKRAMYNAEGGDSFQRKEIVKVGVFSTF